MKRFNSILFVLLVLLFSSCSNSVDSKVVSRSMAPQSIVGVPNPFVDCSSMQEAQKMAGFTISENIGVPTGFEKVAIRVMQEEMIELIYTNDNDEIRIRKARGSGDISGDYTQYNTSETLLIGTIQVATRGEENTVMVATWEKDDFAYSITATAGLEKDTLELLVQNIMEE